MLALVLASLATLALDARRRRFAARLRAVSRAYAPAALSGRSTRSLPGHVALPEALTRIAHLFRYDHEHKDHYPLPWQAVFAATLVLALVTARIDAYLIGPLGYASFPLAWVFATRGVFKHWQTKRRRKLFHQFPDALSMVIRAVRAGIPVTESLGTVGREAPAPTGAEFRRLYDEISIGLSVQDGLWEMARRTGLPEYRFFAVALSLQGQTGGNLTDTLQNLADVIRRRVAIGRKGMALTSEARTTAAALVALPFLAGGGLAVLNPDYVGLLLSDSHGRMILAGALASLGLGVGSMRMIIARTLS
ncbi:MAG TPA: type II secretion system F family protein [Acetobacteraceae bacterium]|nr:type II secretion system F family protein [Acetobacteraceae bacterium]